MQGVRSGLLIFLFPLLALAGNHWNAMLPGGNLRFQGVIIAESCRVEAGDQQMTINMGQISSNRFHSSGEDANPVPFDIHLQDCSTAVSQRVGVSFRGTADGKKPEVFSVGEGPGIATGVGIALFDKDNQLIPLKTARWVLGRDIPAPQHFISWRSIGRPGNRSLGEQPMPKFGSF